MRRRFISPFGITLEILLLFLIIGVWQSRNNAELQEKQNVVSAAVEAETKDQDLKQEKDYIKWVEFNVTYEALNRAYTYDVETYQEKKHISWVDLLAYLGAKYGGDFTRYKEKDMIETAEKLLSGDTTMEQLTSDMQYYQYYREAYGAVLDGLVGEYQVEKSTTEEEKSPAGDTVWKEYYGLKGFGPIAKGFPYSDYDDFGVSRSYGYRRNHLGHDMMGQVGTPVIAVETGYISVMGWNQYGGWRIGINSFDGKRYYYYAHLRQNIPFAESLKEGDVVQAGDVIGYMGRTGYSTTENVNNIDTYHLHFGLQLIFDESQREGNNEIWVNVYPLVRFLSQNRSEVLRNDANKEWYRKYEMKDPAAEVYLEKKD
jgi:murein DD-endopeptidase MepM/ murein hydrolase activator NlpD